MSEVQESSFLEKLKKKQEEKEQEKKEADERKKSYGNFEFEEVEWFALKDKQFRTFRALGNPAQLREKSTDAKYILWSKIVKDNRKSHCHINWPMVEKDGRFLPDPDWILTRLMNKVREGKWVKYEDGHVDEKTGKNGRWVCTHTDTKVYQWVTGNAREKETNPFPPSFYPSIKVMMNVMDNYDTWCKDHKHSKLLTSKHEPWENKETKNTGYNTDVGIPNGCYEVITKQITRCSGIKSMSDIDLIVYRDGKAKTNAYQCYDRSDYPKYVTDEKAYKLADNHPLSAEELAYELYDIDKLYHVSSYAKLKKNLIALFKMCDAELGTSFEEELLMLCKKEAEENPNSQTEQETKEEKEEEQFTSLEEDEKPIVKKEERQRREVPKESKPKESIEDLCKKNFSKWNLLSEEDKQIMISSIDSFKDTIPIYKSSIDTSTIYLCVNTECHFKDTQEPSEYPKTLMTCPLCGHKYN